MTTIDAAPSVLQWYRHRDKGYQFNIVAIDERAGTIDIQHFDDDLEELDLEDWHEMDIEPIEPPEDWTGPVDGIERDDLGYTETGMSSEDWSAPLREEGSLEE